MEKERTMEKEREIQKSKSFIFMFTAVAMIFLCFMAMPRMIFAEVKAYDLIVPDYDSRYLSDEEVEQMPLQVLCYGKNEIYARHGRLFVSKELTEYFNEQIWYNGTVSAENFSEEVFNEYERENIKVLTSREKELKDGGYQLDAAGYSFQPVYDYIYQRDWASAAKDSGSALAIDSGFNLDDDIISTACFLFKVPDAWDKKWTYSVNSEDSISFCCGPVKANTEMDGELCTILRLDTLQEEDYFPASDYLGESKGYYYYLLYPTDVRFEEEYADIYLKMEQGTKDIISTFRLF